MYKSDHATRGPSIPIKVDLFSVHVYDQHTYNVGKTKFKHIKFLIKKQWGCCLKITKQVYLKHFAYLEEVCKMRGSPMIYI